MKNYHYSNFDIDTDSLPIIIWGICIGIIVGAFVSIFYKHWTSSFIKALVKNDVTSKEKACTLSSLRFSGKWYIKNELKKSSSPLLRYVKSANRVEFESTETNGSNTIKEKKTPIDEEMFYLPEETKFTAELRYSGVRNPVGSFVITSILCIAASFFAQFAAPELLQMLDNFLTIV